MVLTEPVHRAQLPKLTYRFDYMYTFPLVIVTLIINNIIHAEIPFLYPTLQHSTLDWEFETFPSDRYCLGNFYKIPYIKKFIIFEKRKHSK